MAINKPSFMHAIENILNYASFCVNPKNGIIEIMIFLLFSKFWGVTNLPPLNKISSRDLRKVRNLREIEQFSLKQKTYPSRHSVLPGLLRQSCGRNGHCGCSCCLGQTSFRLRHGAAVGLVHWAWGRHC